MCFCMLLQSQIYKGTGTADWGAQTMLHSCYPFYNYRALATVGDGNCLYRSVSKAVTGREDGHRGLRDKVVKEFRQHRGYYTAYKHALEDEGIWVGEIEEYMHTTLGAWGDVMHVVALSSIIG